MICNARFRYYNRDYFSHKIITIKPNYNCIKHILLIHQKENYNNYPIELQLIVDKVINIPDLTLLDTIIASETKNDYLYKFITFDFTYSYVSQNIQMVSINDFVSKDLTVKITDSNMKSLIGLTFFREQEINLYAEDYNHINNNYIVITYEDYDLKEEFKLKHCNNMSINNQINAILNYKTRCDEKKFYKLLSNTLYYVNKYENDKQLIPYILLHINKSKRKNITNKLNLNNINEKVHLKIHLLDEGLQKMLTNNSFYKMFIKNFYKWKKNLSQDINTQDITLSDKKLSESLDFYQTVISFDNWKDVINNNECLGVLINTTVTKKAKLGENTFDINVTDINNSFVTINDILGGYNMFLEKTSYLFNSNSIDNLISGNGIGEGNGILPIYINKLHFQGIIKHIEECISISVARNSFSFKPIMLDIYYNSIYTIINKFRNNTTCYKMYIIFIGLIVTINELEKHFNNSYLHDKNNNNILQVKNIINKNIKNIKESINEYYDNNGLISEKLYIFFKDNIIY